MSQSNNEIMIMSDNGSTEPDTPESLYQLPFGSDIDWIDVVHKVSYERDDSVKETTNPKSHHGHHLHSSKNNVGSSNSQRFSGNLKPGTIIGLPGSIQTASSILGHSARRPSGIRIIPRKINGGNGKLTGLDNEPGSPKVSCMGKVLSEKSSHRRRRKSKSTKEEASELPAKSGHKGPGCLLRMARMFCVSTKRAMDIADESIRLDKEKDAKMEGKKKSLERDVEATGKDTPVPVPVPGIGCIKRFASGRKFDWEFQEDAGNNSGEVEEESKLSENSADANDEKDTPVPVLVLGLGGLKQFASGRKLDWNFETEDGEGCVDDKGDAREGTDKIGTQLHVPVLGIGMMKRFASGRKVDWSFEVDAGSTGPATKEDYENKTVSVSVSGRKIDNKSTGQKKTSKEDSNSSVTDSIPETEAHNCAEAEGKHDDLVEVNHAKKKNKNMNNALRRKMDWNVGVKGVRHRSAGLA